MPLQSGASRGIVGANIREMISSGHPQRQAVAAALSNAQRYPRSQGGIVGAQNEGERYAAGGTVGFLHSPIPGRTDLIHASPPSGSYVIPADIVSGIGEGNSAAGASLLQKGLSAIPMPHLSAKGGMGIPKPPPMYTGQLMSPAAAKRGGRLSDEGNPTPILAAGGEFIVPPHIVRAWGGGDLKKGHDVLDAWVTSKRKEIAKEMLRLPGPKRG